MSVSSRPVIPSLGQYIAEKQAKNLGKEIQFMDCLKEYVNLRPSIQSFKDDLSLYAYPDIQEGDRYKKALLAWYVDPKNKSHDNDYYKAAMAVVAPTANLTKWATRMFVSGNRVTRLLWKAMFYLGKLLSFGLWSPLKKFNATVDQVKNLRAQRKAASGGTHTSIANKGIQATNHSNDATIPLLDETRRKSFSKSTGFFTPPVKIAKHPAMIRLLNKAKLLSVLCVDLVKTVVSTVGSKTELGNLLKKYQSNDHFESTDAQAEVRIDRYYEEDMNDYLETVINQKQISGGFSPNAQYLLAGSRRKNEVVAFTRSVSYEGMVDYHLDKTLRLPNEENERKVDVIDEVMPFLKDDKDNAPKDARIIFPYHKAGHWYTGEIQIKKRDKLYGVEIFTHDPYGAGQLNSGTHFKFNVMTDEEYKKILCPKNGRKPDQIYQIGDDIIDVTKIKDSVSYIYADGKLIYINTIQDKYACEEVDEAQKLILDAAIKNKELKSDALPLGLIFKNREMENGIFDRLKHTIVNRIMSEHKDIGVQVSVSNPVSPYKRRQARGDAVSCGPIGCADIEELLKTGHVVTNSESKDDESCYEYGARNLRKAQMDVMRMPVVNPAQAARQQAFVARNTNSSAPRINPRIKQALKDKKADLNDVTEESATIQLRELMDQINKLSNKALKDHIQSTIADSLRKLAYDDDAKYCWTRIISAVEISPNLLASLGEDVSDEDRIIAQNILFTTLLPIWGDVAELENDTPGNELEKDKEHSMSKKKLL